MKYRHALLPLIIALSLFGIAAASTVTLTGSCPTSIINSSGGILRFNLLNSGNGTATNFITSPLVDGASMRNSSAYFSTVAPGTNYNASFYLYNAIANGSYAINFDSSYVQDGNSYSTLFVCEVYIGSYVQGPIGISSSYANKKIVANISNIVADPISAQVAILAPNGFRVQNPSANITVPKYSNVVRSFNVSIPNYTSATFPVLAELSYMYDGIHYSGISTAIVTFGASPEGPGGSKTSLINLAFAIFAIVIIVLIAASLIHGKMGKGKPKAQESEIKTQMPQEVAK